MILHSTCHMRFNGAVIFPFWMKGAEMFTKSVTVVLILARCIVQSECVIMHGNLTDQLINASLPSRGYRERGSGGGEGRLFPPSASLSSD